MFSETKCTEASAMAKWQPPVWLLPKVDVQTCAGQPSRAGLNCDELMPSIAAHKPEGNE